MRAKRLNIRLFLEGQEVPVISAVVTGGINQPCTSTIQVVPTDTLHGIKPRTLVHLFFLDLYPTQKGLDAVQAADMRGYGGLSSGELASLGENYKLLFTGEVLSYIFEKRAGERVFLLQCMDFTSYWDVAKQFFHTGGTRAAARKTSAFLGSSSTAFSGGKRSAANAIVKILTQKPSTTNADGLLGGISHLLETIGGVFKSKKRRFRGLNDFFSAANLRLKFSQMIGISSKDTSSKKLFNHKTFKKWLKQTLSRSRNLVSFREIMDLLLGRIFHQYSSIPAPYFREEADTKVEVAVPGKKKVTGGNKSAIKKRISALSSFLKQMKNASNKKGETHAEAVERKIGICKKQGGKAFIEGTVMKIPGAGNAAQMDLNFLRLCSLVTDTPSMSAAERKANKALRAYKKMLGARGKGTKKNADAKRMEKLFTTVLNPNIWFAPPPRCNVVFPDFYTNFTYRRNFMEEITRFFMTAQKRYSAKGVDPFRNSRLPRYFAPNLEFSDTEDAKKFKSMSQSAKKGVRFLLPHEIFSGIIPKFDHMSDVSSFKSIAKEGPGVDDKGKTRRMNYLQRVANYLFFSYRFGPRVINLDMHFHPYMVPGVPALVLDRYYSQAELKALDGGAQKRAATALPLVDPEEPEGSDNMKDAKERLALIKSLAGYARANYLGLVQGITHSISQSGGTTQVTMSHCRTHDETLDGLKGFGKAVVRFPDGTKTKTFPTTVSAGGLGGTGSEGEREDYKTTQAAQSSTVGKKVKGAPGYKVKKVVEHPDYTFGMGPNGEPSGTAFFAVAKKTIYKKRLIHFPFEKAVFPGWMSPIYTNLNIGCDFYHEMFGVKSICDPAILTDEKSENAETKSAECVKPAEPKAKEAESKKKKEEEEDPDAKGSTNKTFRAEIKAGSTVYEAAEQIMESYSHIKANKLDLDEFFRAYGYREIATLTQILGTPEFVMPTDPVTDANAGKILEPQKVQATDPKTGKKSGPNIVKTEGFHSRAFGPYQNMEGLDMREVQDHKGRKKRNVDSKIDPRMVRHVAIEYYRQGLEASKGQVG